MCDSILWKFNFTQICFYIGMNLHTANVNLLKTPESNWRHVTGNAQVWCCNEICFHSQNYHKGSPYSIWRPSVNPPNRNVLMHHHWRNSCWFKCRENYTSFWDADGTILIYYSAFTDEVEHNYHFPVHGRNCYNIGKLILLFLLSNTWFVLGNLVALGGESCSSSWEPGSAFNFTSKFTVHS
jgi:hypothetical protein